MSFFRYSQISIMWNSRCRDSSFSSVRIQHFICSGLRLDAPTEHVVIYNTHIKFPIALMPLEAGSRVSYVGMIICEYVQVHNSKSGYDVNHADALKACEIKSFLIVADLL